MILSRITSLVEDNADEAHLTMRMFEKSGVLNVIMFATDGGAYPGRDTDKPFCRSNELLQLTVQWESDGREGR